MLVNTDIQLALAQLGIITAIDKQLKEILQYVGGKRMSIMPCKWRKCFAICRRRTNICLKYCEAR